MHNIVRGFGWNDGKGRISFWHTLGNGKSHLGFEVVNDSNRIIVRTPDEPDITPPYWTHDSLLNAFAYKLRRLIVVHGKKKKGQIKYESARLHWEPNLTKCMNAIESVKPYDQGGIYI